MLEPFFKSSLSSLGRPASAAGQDSAEQANDYDKQLLHRDHPHVVDSPKAAEHSLGCLPRYRPPRFA